MNTGWLTLACAAVHFRIPLDVIEAAIMDRELSVRVACGARVVPKHEIQALYLRLQSERGCEECEE